jgi:hypothetical protein
MVGQLTRAGQNGTERDKSPASEAGQVETNRDFRPVSDAGQSGTFRDFVPSVPHRDKRDIPDTPYGGGVRNVPRRASRRHAGRDSELLALADRVRRLAPSHRDPETFHVEKSEIERLIRLIAARLAGPPHRDLLRGENAQGFCR